MEKDLSAQDDVEIGDDLSINIVLDENDNVIGAISDEIIVATSSEGSVVDEIVDVLDANGDLLLYYHVRGPSICFSLMPDLE